MAVLAAAVAIVAVLCLLDLVLTFGVIRRLREHTELISSRNIADLPIMGLTAGELPEAVSAVTISGEPVHTAAGFRVVAFFSVMCSVCPERVAPFTAYVTRNGLSRDSVLAVVVGGQDAPPPYQDQLAQVAQVCAEDYEGALGRAFKVIGYPAFCLLDADGAMLATGFDPARLPEPAAAR
jgi:hypothetical protein